MDKRNKEEEKKEDDFILRKPKLKKLCLATLIFAETTTVTLKYHDTTSASDCEELVHCRYFK